MHFCDARLRTMAVLSVAHMTFVQGGEERAVAAKPFQTPESAGMVVLVGFGLIVDHASLTRA